MPRSSQYTHWMQELDIYGNVISQNYRDIEEFYDGLLYVKAEGLNDIGEAKNIYTEEYADSDRKRVYLPGVFNPNGTFTHEVSDIANKCTTIKMTFLIVGDQKKRQIVMDDFFSYVRTGIHRYWDDARNREFDFIVVDEIKVSDERWHGSQPYVEVEIPMLNLNGKTRLHISS